MAHQRPAIATSGLLFDASSAYSPQRIADDEICDDDLEGLAPASAPASALLSSSPHAFRQSLRRFHYGRTDPDCEVKHEQAGTNRKSQPHERRPMKSPATGSAQSSRASRSQRPLNEYEPGSDIAVKVPTSSPTTAKRRRQSSKYAPPSKYAHLPKLLDILEHNLICVFVGTNPGIRTATAGHAYAHPSNSFWKLLHSSGCTDRRCRPEEDVDLPRLYAMGNTNIVERPSKDAAELSKAEMADGTPILEAKIRQYKPEAVCIVGKGIWEAIWRYRHGKNPSKDQFKWGWQDDSENMGTTDENDQTKEKVWTGARVYVTSSTSGLSASLKPAEKEAIWKPFGQWVKSRREERADTRDKGHKDINAPPILDRKIQTESE